MGKYITNFATTAEFEAAESNLITPHVSLTRDNMDVHYLPYHDYSQDYLTTVALEGGTISFNILKNMGTDMITSISYSTDNGETWTTTNNVNNKVQHLTISVNVSEGDKVLWKGDAQQLGYYDEDDYYVNVGSFFSSDCEFNVQGNVMSMLYGDDFVGKETLKGEAELTCLFSDYSDSNECLVVSAEHMVLPATTLANWCYSYMFKGCTSLETAPELPATTLANGCYFYMFEGCTSLVIAPELHATTLASDCYDGMFMGCTNLTTAPELPATTLANNCYFYMFSGCTSLVIAPELPATTLANNCYQYMFQGCTSLVTAPELPATTLAQSCYSNMFERCSNLNSITCLATDISASFCTDRWVDGVAASGTFTKAGSMSSWTRGNNGIPNGWTVQDA